MDYDLTPAGASALDASDPLASFASEFLHPFAANGNPALYLAGNSLGLQPRTARAALDHVMDEWAGLAVSGWAGAQPPWVRIDEPLARRIAPLAGALPSEVAVSGSLTTNLHAMLASFYRPSGGRYKVLVEDRLFPSDRYALAAQANWHGFDGTRAVVEVKPAAGEAHLTALDFERAMDREEGQIALVLVGGINYYSGQALPVSAIASAARARGIPVGVDLAHAIGNIPLALHDSDVDFAVWCGYKYLNGGPGAPAGMFVHERHHGDESLPRLSGWWGHQLSDRFRMRNDFVPATGASGWQISTPTVIALAPLAAALDHFSTVGMEALRAKSVALTGYLEALLGANLADSVRIVTPSNPAQRGAQLSLRIPGLGKSVFDRLSADGVVCDWREPDVIRAAPAPLYNSFRDVRRFTELLGQAIREEAV